MKILVLNDTRAELHYGCDLVMMNIMHQLSNRGIEAIGVQNGTAYENVIYEISINEPDLVIINGEGTLHHSQKTAKILADIMVYMQENSIGYYIINATIEDNDDYIMDAISKSEHIFVRESSSQLYLKSEGICSTICPDLSMNSITNFFNIQSNTGDITYYSDSVLSEATEFVEYIAGPSCQYISLSHYPVDKYNPFLYPIFNYIRLAWHRFKYFCRLRNNYKSLSSYRNTLGKLLSDVSSARGVITGRFHLVCICIALRVPFVAVESNTFKISGMLRDVGLDTNRFIENASDFGDGVIPFTNNELRKIEEYLEKQAIMISAAFDLITHKER